MVELVKIDVKMNFMDVFLDKEFFLEVERYMYRQ